MFASGQDRRPHLWIRQYRAVQKYSLTAYEAMIMPICHEIERQAPIRSRRQSTARAGSDDDPLTARTQRFPHGWEVILAWQRRVVAVLRSAGLGWVIAASSQS